jgi:adenine-specific DNA-methyltransferase
VWETLVANDEPDHYGVACKRTDARDPSTRSAFNDRRRMPGALRACVEAADARVVVVSCNDEAWLSPDELVDIGRARGEVLVLAIGSKRYVGAQIGIHNPAGQRVGQVSHVRNTELVVIAGELAPAERQAIRSLAQRCGASVATAAALAR